MDKKKHSKLYMLTKSGFYENLRSLLGNTWAMFYLLIGGREAGKSYAVMKFFLKTYRKNGNPFYWLRLNENATRKLLINNAKDLIDADLRRLYNLNDLVVRGECVYEVTKRDKNGKIREKRLLCRVMALSTYYGNKGQALFDKDWLDNNPEWWYNIAFDEFNRERGEKRCFDIVNALANQLENLIRTTKKHVRILCIANTLEEGSDLLEAFNFVPETFGRFKLKKKKCIIENIPITEAYKQRRDGSAADILVGKDNSSFSNEVALDKSRVWKGKLTKPQYVIVFDKYMMFTVWEGNIIAPYNNEKVRRVAMRPALDLPYSVDALNAVVMNYNARTFWFKNLLTAIQFKKEMRAFLPKK